MFLVVFYNMQYLQTVECKNNEQIPMIIECKICFSRLKGANLLKGRTYFQKTLYINLLSKILKSSLMSF